MKLLERLSNMRFFTRILILYLLILSAVLLALTQYVSYNTTQLLRDSQLAASGQMIQAIQSLMRQKLNTTRDIIFRFYGDKDLSFLVMDLLDPDRASDILSNGYEKRELVVKLDDLSSLDRDIFNLVFMDTDGRVAYLFDQRLSTFEENAVVLDLYPESRRGSLERYVVPVQRFPFTSGAGDQDAFAIVNSLLYPGTSRYAGKVGFVFGTRAFQRVFEEFRNLVKGSLMILSSDGEVLFDSSGRYRQEPYPFFDALMAGKETVDLEEPSLVHVVESPQDAFIYAAVMPLASVHQGMSMLTNSTYVAAILMLLLVFAAYILVAGRISRRIRTINRAMNSVISSDLAYRIPTSRRHDEFEEIALHFNRMCDSLQAYIDRSYRYELKQKAAELKMLEAQINPHFLYNSLEIIRSRLELAGCEAGGEMIQSLASLFRYSIKGRPAVRIADEIEYCRLYLEVFNARYGNAFRVDLSVDDDILELGIIKNLLQPLLENFIVHGLDRTRENNRILLRGFREGPAVLLEVRDNGQGIHPSVLSHIHQELTEKTDSDNNRIGLANIHERIRLLFGSEFGLSVESDEGEGTTIRVRFPAKGVEELQAMLTVGS